MLHDLTLKQNGNSSKQIWSYHTIKIISNGPMVYHHKAKLLHKEEKLA